MAEGTVVTKHDGKFYVTRESPTRVLEVLYLVSRENKSAEILTHCRLRTK